MKLHKAAQRLRIRNGRETAIEAALRRNLVLKCFFSRGDLERGTDNSSKKYQTGDLHPTEKFLALVTVLKFKERVLAFAQVSDECGILEHGLTEELEYRYELVRLSD